MGITIFIRGFKIINSFIIGNNNYIGVDKDYELPRELLLSGTEVHAKIICGNEKMGYSLFYGLWEFFYEKIVFFF